jgi:hypothetical protein
MEKKIRNGFGAQRNMRRYGEASIENVVGGKGTLEI